MGPLWKFLRDETNIGELCVVRLGGYVVRVAYIDSEGLFEANPSFDDHQVTGDSWGTMPVTDRFGNESRAPCHYVDLAETRV